MSTYKIPSEISDEHPRGKLEAFDWLVKTKTEQLLTFGLGTTELMERMPNNVLEKYIQDIVSPNSCYTPEIDCRRIVRSMSRDIRSEARRVAQEWARKVIDEVWQNRHDPDYDLPIIWP